MRLSDRALPISRVHIIPREPLITFPLDSHQMETARSVSGWVDPPGVTFPLMFSVSGCRRRLCIKVLRALAFSIRATHCLSNASRSHIAFAAPLPVLSVWEDDQESPQVPPKERQLLRARRSVVQRLPVVLWLQRTEDFHKTSIHASRQVAELNFWRKMNGDMRGMPPGSSISTGLGPREPRDQPQHAQQERKPREAPPVKSTSFCLVYVHDTTNRNSMATQQHYNTFLERANTQFAQQDQHAPDSFMDQEGSSLSAWPYNQCSTRLKLSSVECVAAIADEKQNSPLNKAMESVRDYFRVWRSHLLTILSSDQFTDANGRTAEFVQKLRGLSSRNSRHEPSIEKFLTKSEEALLDTVKEGKRSSVASLRSGSIRICGCSPNWALPIPRVAFITPTLRRLLSTFPLNSRRMGHPCPPTLTGPPSSLRCVIRTYENSQEWVGIAPNSKSDLFVFVGCWSE